MSRFITITLDEIPPTTNMVWRHSMIHGFPRTYMTKEAKDFKKRVKEKVPDSWLISEKNIKVVIGLYFPTKRRYDVDNYSKALLDSFEGEIYHNDSQIIDLHIMKYYCKNNPQTIISFEELE